MDHELGAAYKDIADVLEEQCKEMMIIVSPFQYFLQLPKETVGGAPW
jgi:hypothetical protein